MGKQLPINQFLEFLWKFKLFENVEYMMYKVK